MLVVRSILKGLTTCPVCCALIARYSAAERAAVCAVDELAKLVKADAPARNFARVLAAEAELDYRLVATELSRHRQIHNPFESLP